MSTLERTETMLHGIGEGLRTGIRARWVLSGGEWLKSSGTDQVVKNSDATCRPFPLNLLTDGLCSGASAA